MRFAWLTRDPERPSSIEQLLASIPMIQPDELPVEFDAVIHAHPGYSLRQYSGRVQTSETTQTGSEIVSLTRWCQAVGVSQITAWRFRKRGWLKTINIAGRVYLTGAAAREFARRAEAGEFAREPIVPRRSSR